MKLKIVGQTIASILAILLGILVLVAVAFGLIWFGYWALGAGVVWGTAVCAASSLALGIASRRLRWANDGSFIIALSCAAVGVLLYGAFWNFFLPIALVMGAALAGLFLIGRLVVDGVKKLKATRKDGFVESPYWAEVRYDLSLEELIKNAGFDLPTSPFVKTIKTDKKPEDGKRVHFTLIRPLSDNLNTGDMFRYFNVHGFRRVDLWELLAFAAKYPDVQRNKNIAALGSQWEDSSNGRFFAPCLVGDKMSRGICLDFYYAKWPERKWALAVRIEREENNSAACR